MLEKTLIMIKFEHVQLAEIILKELDEYGKRTITAKVDTIPKEVIEAHYFPHKNKPIFNRITCSFIGKPAVIAVYEGEGIIKKFKEIIGPTEPSKAPKYTIRGKYSNDSIEKAEAENRTLNNVIHCSENKEEAEREMYVWKRYFVK